MGKGQLQFGGQFEGNGAAADSQCTDMLAKGSCPRRFCKWCGTNTKEPGTGKSGKGKSFQIGKGSFNPAYFGPQGVMQFQFQKQAWGKGKGKGTGPSLKDFPPECKVWVGNLEPTVTYSDLQTHFNQVGKVKWAHVLSNSGAGTAGVAFGSAEEATAAITTLNGSDLKGCIMECDVWSQKENVVNASI